MAGTNGEPGVTSGASNARVLAIVVPITLAFAVVNALTVADDHADAGQRLAAWEPWAWELTSAAFWIAAALPLVALLRRLQPPALHWPASLAAHVAISVPVCVVHVAWLAATRWAIYAALGLDYGNEWSWNELVYEWRKDVLSIFAFAAVGYAADRWSTAAPAAAVPPYRLEVRDGARVRWFTASEIERVEAAGNYVALHTGAGDVLHRATLASLEADLATHGFVRIHRSRLVRRDAVSGVTTTPSGDFEATLASGAIVTGSRRYRSGLRPSPLEGEGPLAPWQAG